MPSRRRWKNCFSPWLYRHRNAVERMFGRLKDFRRIATRYDRLARNFLAAVCLAATLCYWLCVWALGPPAIADVRSERGAVQLGNREVGATYLTFALHFYPVCLQRINTLGPRPKISRRRTTASFLNLCEVALGRPAKTGPRFSWPN